MKKLVFALLLSASTVALADLAPLPPIDVCTVESQKKDGEECLACTGEKPDNSCQQEATKRGFEKRCTSNAAGGSELWCGKPVAISAPQEVPPPQKRGVCSVEITSDRQSLWPIALFAASALFLRRRARKS